MLCSGHCCGAGSGGLHRPITHTYFLPEAVAMPHRFEHAQCGILLGVVYPILINKLCISSATQTKNENVGHVISFQFQVGGSSNLLSNMADHTDVVAARE